MNRLYYGDNLEVLREHIPSKSVDLVYLDPPFNSNRNYNVIFARRDTKQSADQAQIEAFGDTWRWTPITDQQYRAAINGGVPPPVADALRAFRTLLGENDAMAYLVNMAPRLVEMHRVLKLTGSLYLHCDPTMSHYLRVLLDAIFGPEHFRNEIIWQRSTGKSLSTVRLPNNHDVLLVYCPTDAPRWSEAAAFVPYDEQHLDEKTASKYRHRDADGRLYRLDSLINPNADRPNLTYEFLGVTRVWRWTRARMQQGYEDGIVVQSKPGRVPQMKRYLDEQRGRPLGDVWTDIDPINSQAAERLGYPTQKPLALLERIILLSSNEGDVVLDPFCGCGTTIDAAQRLNRAWAGIDVTYIAVDLIEKRLRHTFGDEIRGTYEIRGIPRDRASAQALFNQSPFDFERWAVSLVQGQPNQRQVGDRGIDGVVRFNTDNRDGIGRLLVSVKGGRQIGPAYVRDLRGTVENQAAEMGLLITMHEPTRGMVEEADRSGSYRWPVNAATFNRLQIRTVDELLSGKMPKMPPPLLPYIAAARTARHTQQLTLDT